MSGSQILALAVVAAGVSASLIVGAPPGRRLAGRPAVPSRRRRSRDRNLVRMVVAVALVSTVAVGVSASLVVVAVAVVVVVAAHVVLNHRDARAEAARRHDVARACRVLAAQLRIGQVPAVALRSAALDCPPLERAAAAQAIGGDVVTALHQVEARPGHEGLGDLAMAWALADRTGAPLAHLATRVSESLRTVDTHRSAVSAELSAPRASGRILAVLPAAGLMLGVVVGGDPLDFLAFTLAGRSCLLGGVLLAAGGVLWTEHLADRAAR